jgi:hypothetical protein
MRKLDLPSNTKIAFSQPSDRLTEYRFVETLLLNRGFHTRIFDQMDAAKAWLLEDSEPSLS